MLSVNGKHTHECHSEQQRLCWSEMDFSGKPLLFLCMPVSHFKENKRRTHTANTHPGLMAVVPFSGGRVSPWGDYSFCCSCACVNPRGLIYTRGRCRKVNKTWTRQTFFFPSQKKNRNGWWDAEEALTPCDFSTAIRRIIGCWVTELLFLCLC